jgi:hypothetical protein
MRYEPSDGWQAGVYALTDQLFLTRLGPEISESAKRYCPVFFGQNSTATEVSRAIAESLGTPMPGGDLRDSIEFHLRVHTLIVRATGSSDRSYAYWVETGHRIVVFSYDTGRTKAPQPFLRPALFTVRGAA